VVEARKSPGITWTGVANLLGCSESSAIGSHKAAMKKLDAEAAAVASPKPPSKSLAAPTRALKRYMKSMGRVTDKTIEEGLEKVIGAVLWHLNHNPEIIATASFRDLSSMLGMSIEKRQLLKGEPTAITRFQDIRKLDEVAEMLNSELKRRGKLIDVVAEEMT
jgi:hypothetical protein